AATVAAYTIAGPGSVSRGASNAATVKNSAPASPRSTSAAHKPSQSHSGTIDASLVVAIAAAAAAFVSAFVAGRALREARKANALPALIDFVREYRRYEPDRRYVLRDLRQQHDPHLGISDLPDVAREHVVHVC